MLDYQNTEKDVAESLMELNNGMKEIEESETFKVAMGMLLSIGNALNGSEVSLFGNQGVHTRSYFVFSDQSFPT